MKINQLLPEFIYNSHYSNGMSQNLRKAGILCNWPSCLPCSSFEQHSLLNLPSSLLVSRRNLSQYHNFDTINPSIYNIVSWFTGMTGCWDKRLIDQASDVPSLSFFHNFFLTWGIQNSLFL